jgi:hypothetical protein
MNVPRIGIIYHVVDRSNNKIVKVGSTITSLKTRWKSYNQKKFSNHFLKEIRRIESSEFDWFEPKNPRCPFLWHLVAAEHLEILKQGTFKKGKFSNQMSSLDQKYFGFDGHSLAAAIGAQNQKREDKARGGHTQGPIQGKRNLESGLWKLVVSLGGKASGKSKSESKQKANAKNGERFGRWSVDSGHLAKQRTPEHQKKASEAGVHVRCHVNRNIKNPECKLCQGINNGTDVLQ